MTREEARKAAELLVSKMTLEEKASQLLYESPAIERLGIHEFCWWNEALHGVARADVATVFPQAIGLGATFNPRLIGRVAEAISTEARAKYNESSRQGDYDIYKNLTYWSPNINIFRDPRWGRGQETYGEDPFLTAEIGKSFVEGLQGNGEFLRAAACAKHFAVHSGPEKLRHSFDARCSEKDLGETYLPAFEKLVKEAHVEGVMGAYNRLNGEPCCAHSHIMGDILFGKWNFEGYFVSDCGAICDFHKGHKITKTGKESAAMAVKAGCNINCGEAYNNILLALEDGLIDEEDIDRNVIKAYTTRFLLGEFEENSPFAEIGFEKIDCAEHAELNRETARQSLVLLKNNGLLPLNKNKIDSIAVIGPNANSVNALTGNYCGAASKYVTIVDGIRNAVPKARINYSVGTGLIATKRFEPEGAISSAVSAAAHSQVTVLCVGLDAAVEGEENSVENQYIYGGDRRGVSLPDMQIELIDKVCRVCENVIVIMLSGGAMDFGSTALEKASALIQAWYPGAQGGNAVADLLFGEYSPSGRLPVTLYPADAKLPEFTDYSMENRTYRFYKDEPRFPFGFGLGYVDFKYSGEKLLKNTKDELIICVDVENTGEMQASEVTQVYAKYSHPMVRVPNFQLCGISVNSIEPGQKIKVEIRVDKYWLKAVDDKGNRIEPEGTVTLYIGGHQPDKKSRELSKYQCVEIIL